MWFALFGAILLGTYVFVSRNEIYEDALRKLKVYVLSLNNFKFLKQEAWKLKSWNSSLYNDLIGDHEVCMHVKHLKEADEAASKVRSTPGTAHPSAGSAAGTPPVSPGARAATAGTGFAPHSLLQNYANVRQDFLAALQKVPATRAQAEANPVAVLGIQPYFVQLKNDLQEAEADGKLGRHEVANLTQAVKDIEASGRGWLLAEGARVLIAAFPKCLASAPEVLAVLESFAMGNPETDDEVEQDIEDMLGGEDDDEDPFEESEEEDPLFGEGDEDEDDEDDDEDDEDEDDEDDDEDEEDE